MFVPRVCSVLLHTYRQVHVKSNDPAGREGNNPDVIQSMKYLICREGLTIRNIFPFISVDSPSEDDYAFILTRRCAVNAGTRVRILK